MKWGKGLAGKLEFETYYALRPIFLKYLSMKKPHMSRDRIAGIMEAAYLEATKEKESDPKPVDK